LHRQGFPPCSQPSCPMALSVWHSHTQPLPRHTQHGFVRRVRKSLGVWVFFIMARVTTREVSVRLCRSSQTKRNVCESAQRNRETGKGCNTLDNTGSPMLAPIDTTETKNAPSERPRAVRVTSRTLSTHNPVSNPNPVMTKPRERSWLTRGAFWWRAEGADQDPQSCNRMPRPSALPVQRPIRRSE